jgi:hypothetical protein
LGTLSGTAAGKAAGMRVVISDRHFVDPLRYEKSADYVPLRI